MNSHADLFPDLPGAARIWIFAAESAESPARREALVERLGAFLPSWTSHGRRVRGDAAFLEGHFLVLGGAVEGGISGCGIDQMVRAVRHEAETAGVAIASPLRVFWRASGGAVECLPRGAFRKLIRAGVVGPNTPVFDPTVQTLAELRSGAFEKPLHASWHARVFRLPVNAT